MLKQLVFLVIIMSLLCSVVGADLQDGLIVHYPFDEGKGNDVSDNSGNDNNAELLGGAEWLTTEGRYGGTLNFNGNDTCVVDENGGNYINGLTAFTVSVWVKSSEINHDRGFVMGIDPDGQDRIFGLRYDKSSWDVKGGVNVIKASLTTTGGTQTYESKSDVQTTEWQHIAYSWESGQKLSMYINGIFDDTPTHNSDATEGEVSDVVKLIVGKGAKDSNGSWLGLVDEFRLYNRSLSEREIEMLRVNATSVTPLEKLTTTWGKIKRM